MRANQLPSKLYVVDSTNGAAPSGCELVLDDVDGGNPERDYFLVSVVNGDPDVLDAMTRAVAARWNTHSDLVVALRDLLREVRKVSDICLPDGFDARAIRHAETALAGAA